MPLKPEIWIPLLVGLYTPTVTVLGGIYIARINSRNNPPPTTQPSVPAPALLPEATNASAAFARQSEDTPARIKRLEEIVASIPRFHRHNRWSIAISSLWFGYLLLSSSPITKFNLLLSVANGISIAVLMSLSFMMNMIEHLMVPMLHHSAVVGGKILWLDEQIQTLTPPNVVELTAEPTSAVVTDVKLVAEPTTPLTNQQV